MQNDYLQKELLQAILAKSTAVRNKKTLKEIISMPTIQDIEYMLQTRTTTQPQSPVSQFSQPSFLLYDDSHDDEEKTIPTDDKFIDNTDQDADQDTDQDADVQVERNIMAFLPKKTDDKDSKDKDNDDGFGEPIYRPDKPIDPIPNERNPYKEDQDEETKELVEEEELEPALMLSKGQASDINLSEIEKLKTSYIPDQAVYTDEKEAMEFIQKCDLALFYSFEILKKTFEQIHEIWAFSYIKRYRRDKLSAIRNQLGNVSATLKDLIPLYERCIKEIEENNTLTQAISKYLKYFAYKRADLRRRRVHKTGVIQTAFTQAFDKSHLTEVVDLADKIIEKGKALKK